MARYKEIDTSPRFLAVDLSTQLLPGTFEHALNELLDHDIDLSDLDCRYCNDETGATAYPPAMLLKVILFAYSQGIVSSRGIEQACREHVTFIALCGDTAPHFTTIAHFVSTVGADIARVFAAVVAICDAQGLIGREMFVKRKLYRRQGVDSIGQLIEMVDQQPDGVRHGPGPRRWLWSHHLST